jgi:hypothetical protein
MKFIKHIKNLRKLILYLNVDPKTSQYLNKYIKFRLTRLGILGNNYRAMFKTGVVIKTTKPLYMGKNNITYFFDYYYNKVIFQQP